MRTRVPSPHHSPGEQDVDSEALATLIVNRMRGVLKVRAGYGLVWGWGSEGSALPYYCCCGARKITASKAPGFGDNRKAMLQDMAVMTGGTVISSDIGVKLENVTLKELGMIKLLEQTKVRSRHPPGLMCRPCQAAG